MEEVSRSTRLRTLVAAAALLAVAGAGAATAAPDSDSADPIAVPSGQDQRWACVVIEPDAYCVNNPLPERLPLPPLPHIAG